MMSKNEKTIKKQRKMYIDVDGVLVVWDRKYNCVELARGFGRLMRFCKIHEIQPYWLTSWSKNPTTLLGLESLLWPTICPTMARPKIAPWEETKAKVVDLKSDFVWIEDGLGARDLEILEQHNLSDRFFMADGLDQECLLRFMDFTQRRLGLPEIEDWGPFWESVFTRSRKEMIDRDPASPVGGSMAATDAGEKK